MKRPHENFLRAPLVNVIHHTRFCLSPPWAAVAYASVSSINHAH